MSKLVEQVKENIRRMDPNIQSVKVKVERSPEGEFVSKFHVHSRHGVLHAVKKAASYRKSVDRSFHAIIKQIQKIKAKRLKRRNGEALEDVLMDHAS